MVLLRCGWLYFHIVQFGGGWNVQSWIELSTFKALRCSLIVLMVAFERFGELKVLHIVYRKQIRNTQ